MRGVAQGEKRFEAREQRSIVGIGLPSRHRKRFKAVFELLVTADGQIGLPGSHTDQRNAQGVAQAPQDVEQGPLLGTRSPQEIVPLIENEHAQANSLEQTQREILDWGKRLVRWSRGRVHRPQTGRIKPLEIRC